ncbi:hypothetical protein MLD38_004096 [Melastoma candidum]|uniref:Uncharacterized protein n=1 Tax=Melastoma candidum TaxID=119954 RepID=A0ACB9S7T8_9MYRT|nr:hypothetical protein MLD38_004096 [Melastoma candidum]
MKESDDPFGDFQDSMLRMIREKGIYSRDGLKDLLRCFLELNSTRYHEVIIRAFSEIQQGVLSDHRMTNRPGISGLGGSWRWKAMGCHSILGISGPSHCSCPNPSHFTMNMIL